MPSWQEYLPSSFKHYLLIVVKGTNLLSTHGCHSFRYYPQNRNLLLHEKFNLLDRNRSFDFAWLQAFVAILLHTRCQDCSKAIKAAPYCIKSWGLHFVPRRQPIRFSNESASCRLVSKLVSYVIVLGHSTFRQHHENCFSCASWLESWCNYLNTLSCPCDVCSPPFKVGFCWFI
jgi:hypothetical protein